MQYESVRIASHLLSARLRHLSLCGDGRDDGGACKTHEKRDVKEHLDHLGVEGKGLRIYKKRNGNRTCYVPSLGSRSQVRWVWAVGSACTSAGEARARPGRVRVSVLRKGMQIQL